MFSYGPHHIAEQKQGDQLEPTYSSAVRIRDAALRTCQKRWTIGRSGERESGISVLVARHDDDDYPSMDNFFSFSLFFSLLSFSFFFPFHLDIPLLSMSLMQLDTPDFLPPPSYPFIPSFFPSPLSYFSLKWIHLSLVKSLMKPDTLTAPSLDHLLGRSQSKPITPTTINQTYIYFPPCSSLIYLWFFRTFPPPDFLQFSFILSIYSIAKM